MRGLPTHQGRAAEKILFTVTGGPGRVIPNNTHFDITRANIEFTGAQAVDLPIPEGLQPTCGTFRQHGRRRAGPAAGGRAAHVPLVMLTVTIISGGGHSVSLGCIRAGRAAAWWLRGTTCSSCGPRTAARPAHRLRDRAMSAEQWAASSPATRLTPISVVHAVVAGIVREMAALADGMTMLAKKDPLANIGGWLALNDDSLAAQCRNLEILTEGFPTYGGLAGRDLEAIAQGLSECTDHDYLRYRVRSIAYLGEALESAGVPVVVPFGGHAVFIDARALLPHLDPLRYPGQALACALYEEGGVRACEIGTVMFGLRPDGTEVPAAMDLVRLAVPRRTYTQSHLDYVIEAVTRVASRAARLPGMRIVSQPRQLRHFTARFAPLR